MSRRKKTDFIVVHCSATRPGQDIGADQIREWHLAKGWADIGYHAVVRRDGRIEAGRPFDDIGAHVAGMNSTTVGICLVGGLDDGGRPVENDINAFTHVQIEAARALIAVLRLMYPDAKVLGHRDLSPDLDGDGKIERHEWLKTCPGFNAGVVFAND